MEPQNQIGAATRRLRVAIDVTAAARQTAGIGRYTRELTAALLDRAQHDYVLFLADSGPSRLSLGTRTIRVRRAGLPARILELAWHRGRVPLWAELWTGPVDIFHAPDFLAPPLRRARTVITVHDLSFLRYPKRAAPGLGAYLGRALPRSLARAAHVVADSHQTRDDLATLLGAPPGKVSVAYPGVGSEFVTPVTNHALDEVRRRYALPARFVLGVGTLEPRKDWPQLIAAFDAVAPEGVALVIAGRPGWGTEQVERAAAVSAAPVQLLGFVPDRDLPALYRTADAFAYVSVYEGFGLPPLEAMACGVPCIVSAASSLPEVVGDAALQVPPETPGALRAGLRRLLGDESLRRQLRAAGPRRAATFTWSRTAAAVEAAYARAVGHVG